MRKKLFLLLLLALLFIPLSFGQLGTLNGQGKLKSFASGELNNHNYLQRTRTQSVAPPIILPTITTSSKSVIDFTHEGAGGNVTSDGGATVTARGVCWGTSANPTILGSHTNNGTGTGSFTSLMTSLDTTSTWHYRAYATNSAGTSYGGDSSFIIRTTVLEYQVNMSGNAGDENPGIDEVIINTLQAAWLPGHDNDYFLETNQDLSQNSSINLIGTTYLLETGTTTNSILRMAPYGDDWTGFLDIKKFIPHN
jgi:hypothetical protein